MDKYIQINSINKQYGKQHVLKDVSLNITKGEIIGLLGPSGAGKTTIIKLLMGMEKMNSGSISIMGKEIPNVNVIQKIGYMAQADALYTDLSGYENMRFYAELYKVNKKERDVKINEALQIVNLQNDGNKIVSNYSGGMKRRLSLAISLIHEPELLILDEPTIGMDPVLRQQIWNQLNNLKVNKGVTTLITTHVMDEALKCDRIAMIRDGKIIAYGTPLDLIKEHKCETIEDVFLKLGGGHNEN